MKIENLRASLAVTIISGAVLLSPIIVAAQTAGETEVNPKLTFQVDGLTCPFCAYGLEKRIDDIASVQQSIINLEEGIVELLPAKGQHINIDEVKEAVIAGGFTPREVHVALAGKLIDWNGTPALSISSTNRAGKQVTTIYVLKENRQLKRLKASAKASGQEVFITGQAAEAPPLGHPDRHPYLVAIETFKVL